MQPPDSGLHTAHVVTKKFASLMGIQENRMKYCRFEYEGTPQFGLIETIAGSEKITRVSQFAPNKSSPDTGTKKISDFPLQKATLLAPVIPSKIVCVGRNYREHAAELGNEVP
ncbi:MAG: fumarylacetoacetate hydrolase family protein, partial [Terriglobales bacterium]